MHLTLRLTSLKGKRTVRDLTDLYYKKSWYKRGKLLKADRSLLPKRLMENNGLVQELAKAEEYSPAKIFSFSPGREKTLREIELLKSQNYTKISQRMNELLNTGKESNVKIDDGLRFSPEYRFSLGLPQVALLTNTKVDYGVPEGYSKTIDKFLQSELVSRQDYFFRRIVERVIMHSNVWDTEEVKWPTRYQDSIKQIRLSRENLIHPDNSTSMMLSGLFKAISVNFPQLSHLNKETLPTKEMIQDILFNSTLLSNRRIETFFHHKLETKRGEENSYRVFVNYNQPIALVSLNKQDPFTPSQGSSEENVVFEYFNRCKQEIGPIDPAIDLLRHEFIPTRYNHSDGWHIGDESPTRKNIPLITCNYGYLNSNSNDLLPPEFPTSKPGQRQSIGVIYAYAQALAMARRQYGVEFVEDAMRNGEDLREPISFDVIGSADGVVYDILSFQLNTLKSEFQSGNKGPNQAWIHSMDGFKLYNKVIPTRLRYKYAKYLDLDMSVVARLFASYYRAVM